MITHNLFNHITVYYYLNFTVLFHGISWSKIENLSFIAMLFQLTFLKVFLFTSWWEDISKVLSCLVSMWSAAPGNTLWMTTFIFCSTLGRKCKYQASEYSWYSWKIFKMLHHKNILQITYCSNGHLRRHTVGCRTVTAMWSWSSCLTVEVGRASDRALKRSTAISFSSCIVDSIHLSERDNEIPFTVADELDCTSLLSGSVERLMVASSGWSSLMSHLACASRVCWSINLSPDKWHFKKLSTFSSILLSIVSSQLISGMLSRSFTSITALSITWRKYAACTNSCEALKCDVKGIVNNCRNES